MKSVQGGDIQTPLSSVDALLLGSERDGQEEPGRVDSGVWGQLVGSRGEGTRSSDSKSQSPWTSFLSGLPAFLATSASGGPWVWAGYREGHCTQRIFG